MRLTRNFIIQLSLTLPFARQIDVGWLGWFRSVVVIAIPTSLYLVLSFFHWVLILELTLLPYTFICTWVVRSFQILIWFWYGGEYSGGSPGRLQMQKNRNGRVWHVSLRSTILFVSIWGLSHVLYRETRESAQRHTFCVRRVFSQFESESDQWAFDLHSVFGAIFA